MKTITSTLRDHLDQTVTTLATIWKITRTDGEAYYFTDHDVAIDYDGNTYLAATGYNRTAVSNNTGLSVDNLDVEGVFDSEQITEVDLRAGKFDYAEIRISIINWSDPSQGILKQRRGRLGEVVLTQHGVFRSELRGLTQQLSQNICSLYQAECRADLGDTKCTVFIKPEILTRELTTSLGQTYRVVTGDLTTINWGGLANNGGFEIDAEALDITAIESWDIVSGNVSLVSDYNDLTAYAGINYLCGENCASFEIKQDIVFIDTFGIDLAQVDAGNVTADFSCYRANNAPDDTGRVLVQFLDADLNPISTLYDTGSEAITPEDTWVQRAVSSVAVPTLTRFVRIRFLGTRVAGVIINTCLDAVDLSFEETSAADTFESIYENRMYEVTVAGETAAVKPLYDTVVGNSTVDGTTTLICKEAWTRNGYVTNVANRRTFSVVLEDVRADDDGWFNYGGLVFETGLNEGVVTEIKDWDAATKTLTLFIPVPFTVYAGSKVRLYPGCDKRLATCSGKFNNVINYRGEPYVPGQDELTSYASSGSF